MPIPKAASRKAPTGATYEARIIAHLQQLGSDRYSPATVNPDGKHNMGRAIGEAYMWDVVAKYADARRKEAHKRMEDQGIVKDKKELDPGDHILADSPSFVITASVTQPVRRFSQEALAQVLSKTKYKVPRAVVDECCEKAKVPSSSTVTVKIAERTS
jgi:hypothetical protein